MNLKISFSIIVIAALVSACARSSLGVPDECRVSDPKQSAPCVTSIFAVLARPGDFDGAYVRLGGVFAASDVQYALFSDRDSSEYSLLENSIQLTAFDSSTDLNALHQGAVISVSGIYSSPEEGPPAVGSELPRFRGALRVVSINAGREQQPFGCRRREEMRGRFLRDLLGEKTCTMDIFVPPGVVDPPEANGG